MIEREMYLLNFFEFSCNYMVR